MYFILDWLDRHTLRQTSWKVLPEFYLEEYQKFSDMDLDKILCIFPKLEKLFTTSLEISNIFFVSSSGKWFIITPYLFSSSLRDKEF